MDIEPVGREDLAAHMLKQAWRVRYMQASSV